MSFLEKNRDDPFAAMENQTHLNKEKIHVRVQAGKKNKITLIEGLDDDLDLERISKAMKRCFSCSSKVQVDAVGHEVILLQGDQRMNVKEWLLAQEILTEQEAKERLVLHGF